MLVFWHIMEESRSSAIGTSCLCMNKLQLHTHIYIYIYLYTHIYEYALTYPNCMCMHACAQACAQACAHVLYVIHTNTQTISHIVKSFEICHIYA